MSLAVMQVLPLLMAVPPPPMVTNAVWSEPQSTLEATAQLPLMLARPSASELLEATSTLGRLPTKLPSKVIATLTSLRIAAPEIDPVVLERALVAQWTARRAGFGRKPILTVIDYAKPASERRLWVFNLPERRRIFWEYVAHGSGSGGEVFEKWSNTDGSLASSLGLYVTRETYRGRRGYSLRMIGLDPGFNDQAYRRTIVIHGAHYMTDRFRLRNRGLLGQSHGCPALDEAVAERVIDYVARGSFVFAHWPAAEWLRSSAWLQGKRPANLRAQPRRFVAQMLPVLEDPELANYKAGSYDSVSSDASMLRTRLQPVQQRGRRRKVQLWLSEPPQGLPLKAAGIMPSPF